MFKNETFEMWDDDTKALNMADHATPPEDMEDEDFDNWGEEDWREVAAFITVHSDNHLEMPVDENNELSWDGVRNASTLNPEDIPIFDKFFEEFELGDWREVKFDELRVKTW